jgi:hypothetical protein
MTVEYFNNRWIDVRELDRLTDWGRVAWGLRRVGGVWRFCSP